MPARGTVAPVEFLSKIVRKRTHHEGRNEARLSQVRHQFRRRNFHRSHRSGRTAKQPSRREVSRRRVLRVLLRSNPGHRQSSVAREPESVLTESF